MGFSLNNTSDARSFKHIQAPRNFALLKSCTTPAHHLHLPLSLIVTSKILLCCLTSSTPSPVNTVHDCPCHLNHKIKMELNIKQNTSNYAATKCASQVRENERARAPLLLLLMAAHHAALRETSNNVKNYKFMSLLKEGKS